MTEGFMVPSDHPDEHWQPRSLAQTSNKNNLVRPTRGGGRNGTRRNTIDVEFWPANHSENIEIKRAGILIVTGLGQMVWGILQMTIGGAIGIVQDIRGMANRRRIPANQNSAPRLEQRRWS